ncbi:hypothetical protein C0Q89_09045 [Lacticaseibacillus rhamnosus]|nr:hypothetical protein C0Q89_09045 [Lacticaseibacillus rhamnosus]
MALDVMAGGFDHCVQGPYTQIADPCASERVMINRAEGLTRLIIPVNQTRSPKKQPKKVLGFGFC